MPVLWLGSASPRADPCHRGRDGVRSEELEALTFPDASFDLFVTHDVFEHAFDLRRAFAEFARVLRPGGSHVFPWSQGRVTVVRALRDGAGVKYLEPPEYHMDPVDPAGVLIATDWGDDLPAVIKSASGLETERTEVRDLSLGPEGPPLAVSVSKKPAPSDVSLDEPVRV